MKFIHTSDWNLGKKIEGRSRIEEENNFCKELVDIAIEENIDIVLIVGNIFDSYNIEYKVEELFFRTISQLYDNGKRCVIIVPGEKDNIKHLKSVQPLLNNSGIIIVTNIEENIKDIHLNECNVEVLPNRVIKLNHNNENINIVTIPYKNKQQYEESVEDISEMSKEYFLDSTINILAGYLNVEDMEGSDYNIKLLENKMIEKKSLPNKSHYIALGGSSKRKQVSHRTNAYYSGSPMLVNNNDSNEKSINLVEIDKSKKKNVEVVEKMINSCVNIQKYKAKDINKAIEKIEELENINSYIYVEVEDMESATSQQINKLKSMSRNIVSILPAKNSTYEDKKENSKDRNIIKEFNEFYFELNGEYPSSDVIDLFVEISKEEGGILNETN